MRILFRTAMVAVVLGACSANTSVPTSTSVTIGNSSIEWSPCSDDTSEVLLCATIEVPYNYQEPDGNQFSLSMVKHPATQPSKRIGSMLVNPGGPGFGGTAIAENASAYLGSSLLEVFDIVGWDPRGTGDSTPAVDCIEEYDQYFAMDPTPADESEKQRLIDASMSFADACEEKNSEILPYISTNNSARDMNTIRQALGEEKITYFGFSYGSELGATWATMFPNTVRAAVLDGATDPTADYVQSGLNQAQGFENEFSKFLKQCSENPLCEFYNNANPRQAFVDLMESVDSQPIQVSSDRAPVNQAVLQTAVAMAMYSSSMWPQLEEALGAAQARDGEGILALYDDYFQRAIDGTYGNELEAFLAISCLDDPGPQSVAEADSHISKFKEVAPLLYPGFTGGYVCVFWPAQTDKRIDITAKGAGPILVIGVTGDAATPLASTRNMAASLEDGRLIVVDANRHTGYGENACVTDATDNYLITTQIDFAEKLC